MNRSYELAPRRAARVTRLGRAAAAFAMAVGVGIAAATPALAEGGDQGSAAAPSANWVNGYWDHHGANGEGDVNVCSYAVGAGVAHCNTRIRTDLGSRALAVAPSQPAGSTCSSSDTNVPSSVSPLGTGAYDPCYLQSAYNVASSAQAHGGGAGQIVSIVDAYADPNVVADLAAYRSFFGLPSCPVGTVSHAGTSCTFQVVNQNGAASPLPAGNSGWATEISLDVEMVSAICPNCQILLVEANSATLVDLGTAVNRAVTLGANVVSNSYGGGEYSSEVSDANTYFNHPGVAIVASSGDSGYGVEFPAAAPNVVAVGGTSLLQYSPTGARSANASETVWSGAGAGCSAYEAKPSWQSDPSCARRMVADVSAVADPYTGVWVYDTYGTSSAWAAYGGTSVAAPIIGSMYALAGNATGGSGQPSSYPYANKSSLTPVTSGSDGSCSPSYFCNAAGSVNGYNGPAGLGTPGVSPNSMAAFSGAPVVATAPSAPTSVAASAGNASANVTWAAPSSNGNSPITGYNVYEGTTSGAESTTPLNGSTPLSATTFSLGVAGLSNGSTYYFTVKALNAVGPSPASAEVSATPSAPTIPSAPTSVAASAGNASANVTWAAPSSNGNSPITGYNVYEGTSSGAESLTPLNGAPLSATTFSLAVPGLTNGSTYYFTVKALNAVGPSRASAEVSATPVSISAPSAPTLTSALPSSNSTVTLSWSAPSSTGGSAITGYNVYLATSPGAESSTPLNSSPLTGLSASVSGLHTATRYYFTVKAVNAVGTSVASNELSAVPGVPPSPVLVSAVAGPGSVTLSWTRPGGSGYRLSGYYVYVGTSPGGESTTPVNSRTSSTGLTVTGLTSGKTYYFTVVAVGRNGSSPPSNELSASAL